MPGYANPQNLNRFSYVLNNPLRYTDPTGHRACGDEEAVSCETGLLNNPTNNTNIGCGNPGQQSCLGNSPNQDNDNGPVIGPLPPIVADECWGGAQMCDNLAEIETLLNWATHIDYFDQLYLILMNYGRPAYKHLKGITPGGPFEGMIGGSLQFVHDLRNPNLHGGQRIGRSILVGLEDWVTDGLSNNVGFPAGAAVGGFVGGVATSETGPGAVAGATSGATIGGAAGMIAVNEGMNWTWDQVNPWIFNTLNLGIP